MQEAPRRPAIGWSLWREVVSDAIGRSKPLPEEWGSRIEARPDAAAALAKLRGGAARLVVGAEPTEHQQALAKRLTERLAIRHDPGAPTTVLVGPPAYNAAAGKLLCHEDAVRLKYGEGLAALAKLNRGDGTVLLAGLSDFGDKKLADWIDGPAR
jgi:hypothetical protein